MNFTNFNADRFQRDFFQREGLLPASMHPVLAGSWIRSRESGVNPYIEEAPVVADFQLRGEADHILMEVARPYFEYFGKLLLFSECALALSNSRGVIIHVEGLSQSKIRKLAERHNFLKGADWNEKVVGTSAIGTAIVERRSILLNGVDHFSYGWHPYSCVAAPVFGAGGDVVGAVNASTYNGLLHIHSMGWVAAMARLIEVDLKKMAMNMMTAGSAREKSPVFYVSDNPLSGQPDMLGKSPYFLLARDTARRVAGTDLGVLLTGETGTGKEVFARYIHHCSGRSGGPFVAVNCGAIPGDLVYSELFGYSEGAFTGASRRGYPGKFEQADGGTLFLDEIGDAPMEVQVGLLRVLEENVVYRLGSVKPVPVRVRVLAASSRDLPELVKEGGFRKDLFYRLAGVSIKIPSLRDRRDDISLLADFFLRKAAEKAGRSLTLGGDARQELLEYYWPGNVRELRSLMYRLAALADGRVIDREALLRWNGGLEGGKSKDGGGREILVQAIEEAGGNIARAARMLGVDRSTLYRRMKKHGIKN